MNKKKSGNVELARFIASLIIVTQHIYNIGLNEIQFHEAWIYVELFLLITGYFTAKHYEGRTVKNPSKDAFIYTIRKFLPLFPYTLIASSAGWVMQGLIGLKYQEWTWEQFLRNFMGDFVFDLLLVSDSYTHPLISPLWYVSAVMIVFPFFCLFVQIKNRYTKLLLGIFLPMMYYGWNGVVSNRHFPHDLIRSMAGMMLGVVIYEISVIFKEKILSIPKALLTVIELLAFIYPIYCCYGNYYEKEYTTTRLYLLCFFIFLLLCIPGYTYSSLIKGSVFNYLGRLSTPMFIIHWYIGNLVNLMGYWFDWSDKQKALPYYTITIVAAMILMFIFDHWKKWQAFIKRDIELID